ncbi:hypothetical protein [Streptomyces sp. NBC_00847]|uniref:hypothetical protein n=1 Tax=unclassified Streptomyces TaxID=2593676 RepID=UPI00225AC79E|nr:hypothetical protein [Streptomyces sp. NBC_00847]MCX4878155.1 hypothetical protein [Streptomyces sp. NBC_00847]
MRCITRAAALTDPRLRNDIRRHRTPAVPLALNLTGGWAAGDACGALHHERGVARRDGNLSGVTDCNIAMRSHHQAAER